MNKRYTEYKLTDAQLKRLSQCVNKTTHQLHGVAIYALERKGLVVKIPNSRRFAATVKGHDALVVARKQGW